MSQLLMQHLQLPPNLDPSPPADRPALARALAKKPEDRWPSVSRVRAGAADGGAATADGPRRRPRRRRRAVDPAGEPADGRRDPTAAPVAAGRHAAAPPRPGRPPRRSYTPGPAGVRRPRPAPARAGASASGRPGSRVLQRFRYELAERFGPADHTPAVRTLFIDTDPDALDEAAAAPAAGAARRAAAGRTCSRPGSTGPAHYLKPRLNGRSLIEGWFDPQLLYKIPRNPADDGRAAVRPAGVLRPLPPAHGQGPGRTGRLPGRRTALDATAAPDRAGVPDQPAPGVRRGRARRRHRRRHVPRPGLRRPHPAEADGVRGPGGGRAAPGAAGRRRAEPAAGAGQHLRRADRAATTTPGRRRRSPPTTTSGTASSARRTPPFTRFYLLPGLPGGGAVRTTPPGTVGSGFHAALRSSGTQAFPASRASGPVPQPTSGTGCRARRRRRSGRRACRRRMPTGRWTRPPACPPSSRTPTPPSCCGSTCSPRSAGSPTRPATPRSGSPTPSSPASRSARSAWSCSTGRGPTWWPAPPCPSPVKLLKRWVGAEPEADPGGHPDLGGRPVVAARARPGRGRSAKFQTAAEAAARLPGGRADRLGHRAARPQGLAGPPAGPGQGGRGARQAGPHVRRRRPPPPSGRRRRSRTPSTRPPPTLARNAARRAATWSARAWSRTREFRLSRGGGRAPAVPGHARPAAGAVRRPGGRPRRQGRRRPRPAAGVRPLPEGRPQADRGRVRRGRPAVPRGPLPGADDAPPGRRLPVPPRRAGRPDDRGVRQPPAGGGGAGGRGPGRSPTSSWRRPPPPAG